MLQAIGWLVATIVLVFIEATTFNLVSVWFAVGGADEGKELLETWGVHGDYEGIGNVILGYGLPEGIREAVPRKNDYIVRV